MMPVWGWLALVALVGLVGVWIGDKYGFFVPENVAPSERAYIEVAIHELDCKKEVALKACEYQHEEEIRRIDRGIYDNIGVDDEEDEEPQDDSDVMDDTTGKWG